MHKKLRLNTCCSKRNRHTKRQTDRHVVTLLLGCTDDVLRRKKKEEEEEKELKEEKKQKEEKEEKKRAGLRHFGIAKSMLTYFGAALDSMAMSFQWQ